MNSSEYSQVCISLESLFNYAQNWCLLIKLKEEHSDLAPSKIVVGENYFDMYWIENFDWNSKKKLIIINNHYKIIYRPVITECSSCKVLKDTSKVSIKLMIERPPPPFQNKQYCFPTQLWSCDPNGAVMWNELHDPSSLNNDIPVNEIQWAAIFISDKFR